MSSASSTSKLEQLPNEIVACIYAHLPYADRINFVSHSEVINKVIAGSTDWREKWSGKWHRMYVTDEQLERIRKKHEGRTTALKALFRMITYPSEWITTAIKSGVMGLSYNGEEEEPTETSSLCMQARVLHAKYLRCRGDTLFKNAQFFWMQYSTIEGVLDGLLTREMLVYKCNLDALRGFSMLTRLKLVDVVGLESIPSMPVLTDIVLFEIVDLTRVGEMKSLQRATVGRCPDLEEFSSLMEAKDAVVIPASLIPQNATVDAKSVAVGTIIQSIPSMPNAKQLKIGITSADALRGVLLERLCPRLHTLSLFSDNVVEVDSHAFRGARNLSLSNIHVQSRSITQAQKVVLDGCAIDTVACLQNATELAATNTSLADNPVFPYVRRMSLENSPQFFAERSSYPQLTHARIGTLLAETENFKIFVAEILRAGVHIQVDFALTPFMAAMQRMYADQIEQVEEIEHFISFQQASTPEYSGLLQMQENI